jgi:hypothetical protein
VTETRQAWKARWHRTPLAIVGWVLVCGGAVTFLWLLIHSRPEASILRAVLLLAPGAWTILLAGTVGKCPRIDAAIAAMVLLTIPINWFAQWIWGLGLVLSTAYAIVAAFISGMLVLRRSPSAAMAAGLLMMTIAAHVYVAITLLVNIHYGPRMW